MKALIVGKGRIGHACAKVFIEESWRVDFFDPRKNVQEFAQDITDYNLVVLAISTKDAGEIACSYIFPCVDAGIPIVTAEKGALAYYFDLLESDLPMIGYNATLGGACGMPSLILKHKGSILGMKGIINATINFFFWARQAKMSEEGILFEAQNKGLCEPSSAATLHDVFTVEMEDTLLKACIMFNLAGLGKPVTPCDFVKYNFTPKEITDHLNSRDKKRLVVEVEYVPDFELHPCYIQGFWHYQNPWLIKGSFKNNAEKELTIVSEIDISAENNILIIERTDGNFVFTGGAGAGPDEIAKRIFEDAKELLNLE